jgi:serine protease Do
LSYPQQVEETRKRYLMRPAGPASGVLIDAEGRVLTSYFHVTGKVKSVSIRLASGKTLPVKVLGHDESLDLVMLQAENPGEKLPFAELAGSDVEVGAQLAVLGRSEDLAAVTVNRGLVSSKPRAGGRTMQISAFVNYGNLGGPAVTVDGKLAGVTGHLRPGSMWGQNSGVGFITPAHVLKETTVDLAAGKTLKAPSRTFLGVAPGPDSPEVLGAPVGRVLANSGAAAAGLKPGDLITHLDGVPVEGWQGLVRNITGRKPGDKVKLTVKRKTETLDLEILLGQSNE